MVSDADSVTEELTATASFNHRQINKPRYEVEH